PAPSAPSATMRERRGDSWERWTRSPPPWRRLGCPRSFTWGPARSTRGLPSTRTRHRPPSRMPPRRSSAKRADACDRSADLHDLDDDELVALARHLAHGEPDALSLAKIRRIEKFSGVREKGHRGHLLHESSHRVVPDEDQGVASSALEDARDAMEALGGEDFPVATPEAGRESGQQHAKQQGRRPSRGPRHGAAGIRVCAFSTRTGPASAPPPLAPLSGARLPDILR